MCVTLGSGVPTASVYPHFCVCFLMIMRLWSCRDIAISFVTCFSTLCLWYFSVFIRIRPCKLVFYFVYFFIFYLLSYSCDYHKRHFVFFMPVNRVCLPTPYYVHVDILTIFYLLLTVSFHSFWRLSLYHAFPLLTNQHSRSRLTLIHLLTAVVNEP